MEPEDSAATTEVRAEVLSERLAVGPLSVTEALRYGIDIASALHKLHESGQTYGALSASNVLLLGSRAEMLAAAAAESADPLDDISSFGALLYHMLTGTTLEGGDGDLSSLYAIPDGLKHVITTCLEENSDRRYQRMRAVVMELKLLGFEEQRKKAASSQETIFRYEFARLEQKIEEIQTSAKAFQEQVESVLGSFLIEVRQELETSRNASRATEEAAMQHVAKLAQAQHVVESVVWQNEALLSRTLEELEVLQERVLAA